MMYFCCLYGSICNILPLSPLLILNVKILILLVPTKIWEKMNYCLLCKAVIIKRRHRNTRGNIRFQRVWFGFVNPVKRVDLNNLSGFIKLVKFLSIFKERKTKIWLMCANSIHVMTIAEYIFKAKSDVQLWKTDFFVVYSISFKYIWNLCK